MKALVKKDYLLEKFDGKGGWTYAAIPEIPQDKKNRFGWVKVKGTIDSFEFENVHLMPMGNGKLFLPVKAEIRKKIRKQKGDMVTIVLYPDHSKFNVPADLEECFRTEPKAHSAFLNLNEGKQKEIISWIYAAKKEETRIERIVNTIEKLMKGKSL